MVEEAKGSPPSFRPRHIVPKRVPGTPIAREVTSNTDIKDATDPTQCNVGGSCSREDSAAPWGVGFKMTATRAVLGARLGAMPSPRVGAFGDVGARAVAVAGSGTGAGAGAVAGGSGVGGGVGRGCAGGGAGGAGGPNTVNAFGINGATAVAGAGGGGVGGAGGGGTATTAVNSLSVGGGAAAVAVGGGSSGGVGGVSVSVSVSGGGGGGGATSSAFSVGGGAAVAGGGGGGGESGGTVIASNALAGAGADGGGGGRAGRAADSPTVSGGSAVAGFGVGVGTNNNVGAGAPGVGTVLAPAVAASATATTAAPAAITTATAAAVAAVSDSSIAGAAAAANAAVAAFAGSSRPAFGKYGDMKAATVPPPPSTVVSTTMLGRPVAALDMVPIDRVMVGSVAAPPRPLRSGMDVAADANPTTSDDMEECDLPARSSSGGGAHRGLAASITSRMGGVGDSVMTLPDSQGLAMDVAADTNLTTGDDMEECDVPAGGPSGGAAHLGLAAAALSFIPWQKPPPQQRTQATAHRIPYAPMPMDCGQETAPVQGAGAAGIAGQQVTAAGGGQASAGFGFPLALSRSQITRNAAIANGVRGLPGTGSTGSSLGASAKLGGAAGGGNGLGARNNFRHSASLALPQGNGKEINQQPGAGSALNIWAGGSSTGISHAWGIGGSSLPRGGVTTGGPGAPSSMIATPAPNVGQAGVRGGVWGVTRGSSDMGWGSRGPKASTGTSVTSLVSKNVSYL